MKTRIMLYVSDVETLTEFWQQTLNVNLDYS